MSKKDCAPGKKFKDGSCFTKESLKKIANEYKIKYKKNIDIPDDKEEIVQLLDKEIKQCSNQACWLRQSFIQEMNNDDIKKYSLKPEGPSKKYDWLSTTNINEVIDQYQNIHKDFHFLGAVPYDFDDLPILGIRNLNFKDLEENGKTKIGIVFNLDTHDQTGSHWVALYADLKKNQIYFFDSFASAPGKRIKKFVSRIAKYLYERDFGKKLKLKKILNHLKKNKKYETSSLKNMDLQYNQIQHQFGNTECGVYSINFILRLVKGETFENITQTITKDKEMNQNRKKYFIN